MAFATRRVSYHASQNCVNLNEGQKHFIKEALKYNPDLLNEIIIELRVEKMKKIIENTK